MAQRDFLESPLISTAFFGGVLFVAAVVQQGPDWLILGLTFVGIWFAVTSGLNEVFS